MALNQALSLLCCCPKSEKHQGAPAPKVLPVCFDSPDCSPRSPESYGFVSNIGKSGFDSSPKDASKRKDGHKGDSEERTVSELDSMAWKMTKSIRKYPKSCKKFHRPRERFMSVIPAQEGADWTALQRWKRGVVAYWEDKAGFTAKSPPKGHMSLLRIAKVQHLEQQYDGCGVMIKHKLEEDFQEVIFIFATRSEAREFSYMLWEFIAKLRCHLH